MTAREISRLFAVQRQIGNSLVLESTLAKFAVDAGCGHQRYVPSPFAMIGLLAVLVLLSRQVGLLASTVNDQGLL